MVVASVVGSTVVRGRHQPGTAAALPGSQASKLSRGATAAAPSTRRTRRLPTHLSLPRLLQTVHTFTYGQGRYAVNTAGVRVRRPQLQKKQVGG